MSMKEDYANTKWRQVGYEWAMGKLKKAKADKKLKKTAKDKLKEQL